MPFARAGVVHAWLTVAPLCSQGRPLEMNRVIFYAAELVLALEYLHSRNVIYRE